MPREPETTVMIRRCIHGRTERQRCKQCNRIIALQAELAAYRHMLTRVKRPGLRLEIGGQILKIEDDLREIERGYRL